MTDIEPYEQEALEHAAECGGEYLESIGKTDLGDLEPEQWEEFIKVVGLNFLRKRAELQPCPF